VSKLNFKKMRVKALKKLLKERGAKCEGCTSKAEFVAMVKKVISDPVVKKKRTGRTLMAEKKYQESKKAAEKGWSDEDYGNGKVKHLIGEEMEGFLKDNKNVIMMFYAPWCGHCKALKPDWVKASEELAEEKTAVVIAAMDCTENQELCKKYKATSYPTLVTFAEGKDAEYEGGRTANAIKQVAYKLVDPSYVKVKQPFKNSEQWKSEDYGNGDVVHLTDEHFTDFRAEHPLMITMFYAPWCGHCKALKPDWVKASAAAAKEGVTLAAVDCTVEKEVCGKYKVEGYPSVKVFSSSDGEPTEYNGSRDEAGVMAQVRELKEKSGETELKDDEPVKEEKADEPAEEEKADAGADEEIDHEEL